MSFGGSCVLFGNWRRIIGRIISVAGFVENADEANRSNFLHFGIIGPLPVRMAQKVVEKVVDNAHVMRI